MKNYPNSIVLYLNDHSYEDLARILNVSRQTIYNYVHGIRFPSKDRLIGLMKALRAWNGKQLSVEDVFDIPYESNADARGRKRTKINRALTAIMQKAEEYIGQGIDADFWENVLEELHYVKNTKPRVDSNARLPV
jgi:transcriptional regulator with XRE-family HTH domain